MRGGLTCEAGVPRRGRSAEVLEDRCQRYLSCLVQEGDPGTPPSYETLELGKVTLTLTSRRQECARSMRGVLIYRWVEEDVVKRTKVSQKSILKQERK